MCRQVYKKNLRCPCEGPYLGMGNMCRAAEYYRALNFSRRHKSIYTHINKKAKIALKFAKQKLK